MDQFDPQAYGPAFAPLLETDRRRSLDAGTPDPHVRDAFRSLSIETAFADATLSDTHMARCCLSAVWLLYDDLDESHTISQGIKTSTGSFWHGIMHRREGDFSNAKYWFRQVGLHAVFDPLGKRAAELVDRQGGKEGASLTVGDGTNWDPFAFVDLCQAVQRGAGSASDLCLDIQQAEWELLFDHCYHASVGS